MKYYEQNVLSFEIEWKYSATVYNECMRRAEEIFAKVVDENDLIALTEKLVEEYEA